MFRKRIVAVMAAAVVSLPVTTLGDCVVIAFRTGEGPQHPIYEVVSCKPAREVIDQLRQVNRNWYGDIQYAERDVAIEVRAANEDAEKFLASGDSEYWYFADTCAGFSESQRIALNEVQQDSICCDLGPVRDVQCAPGGKRLMRLMEN